MSLLLALQFPQILLAQPNSCHNVGQGELIAITALLGGLIALAITVSASAITMGIPAITMTIGIPGVVTKILAGLAIGASLPSIAVPLEPFVHIAAVAAAVEGIKHILGCG
jgi:hypothetical protein